jgi:hypothetical protein
MHLLFLPSELIGLRVRISLNRYVAERRYKTMRDILLTDMDRTKFLWSKVLSPKLTVGFSQSSYI